MLDAQTTSVSVDRPWRVLYEEIWRPETFPRWASGLSRSPLTKAGDRWTAAGPDGIVCIRFTDHNAFGVMDHVVQVRGGPEIHIPLRVIPNEAGAEVVLTLFRQPGMSDAKFLADLEWVRRDLRTLQALFPR